MKINSHNEWDPLREIIVGSAKGSHAVITWTRPEPIPQDTLQRAAEISRQAYPQWLVDEVEEDLDGLATTIEKYGAKVMRPNVHALERLYATPYWQSTGNNAYNARDLHLVVGNSVIESPSYLHNRFFEPYCFYDIWHEYFEEGFRWIAAHKPRLDEPVSVPYHRDENERVLTEEDVRFMELTGRPHEKLHRLTEKEIVFEAANTLRMGRDLLYLVSSSGNWKGARWLQSVLGDEYRVHTTEGIYRSSHIDSTVLCLRPGLVMLNSRRVSPDNCPDIFDSWDKIWFDDVAPTSDEELALQNDVRDPLARELESLGLETNLGEMSSPWVGMNFLSLDPETVVVDERQTSLMRVLEARGFTCVPVRMRHMYTQSGGLHCATLDTVRDGELETYLG